MKGPGVEAGTSNPSTGLAGIAGAAKLTGQRVLPTLTSQNNNNNNNNVEIDREKHLTSTFGFHMHAHLHTLTHTHTRARMHACMHAPKCVHMYICTHQGQPNKTKDELKKRKEYTKSKDSELSPDPASPCYVSFSSRKHRKMLCVFLLSSYCEWEFLKWNCVYRG